MRRYEDLDTLSSDKRYETIYYPKFDYSEGDIYIVSKTGMRLDLLAFEHYNDQTLWFVIALANNLSRGHLVIPPGIRLRIPNPYNIIDINRTIKDRQY